MLHDSRFVDLEKKNPPRNIQGRGTKNYAASEKVEANSYMQREEFFPYPIHLAFPLAKNHKDILKLCFWRLLFTLGESLFSLEFMRIKEAHAKFTEI